MLAVKEKLRTVILEVGQERKTGKSLWILVDDNSSKIRKELYISPRKCNI